MSETLKNLSLPAPETQPLGPGWHDLSPPVQLGELASSQPAGKAEVVTGEQYVPKSGDARVFQLSPDAVKQARARKAAEQAERQRGNAGVHELPSDLRITTEMPTVRAAGK